MYKLLIVDDEESVLEGLEMMDWKMAGIEEVFTATSGKAALEMMQTLPMDIVITDIRMPQMSGLELVEHIRKRWKKTKFVMLSGYSDFEYARTALQQQATDYLLKPVTDEELIRAVSRAIHELSAEWEQISSYQKSISTLRENLPLLRGQLLHDILQGKQITPDHLRSKMEAFGVEAFYNASFTMLIVRLEHEEHSTDGVPLLEYAVCNIVEELFGDHFDTWHCKDALDYQVFLLRIKDDGNEARAEQLYASIVERLQDCIETFLKRKSSILFTPWGTFPDQVAARYQASIHAIRNRIGNARGFILSLDNHTSESSRNGLRGMYEPPTLSQLFELGRWDDARHKLDNIFKELEQLESASEEHLLEAFFHIAGAFAYIAHTNGKHLLELIGQDYKRFHEAGFFRSLHQFRQWSASVLEAIRTDMDSNVQNHRSSLIHAIHAFIEDHISKDISVQTIADHVHLHPVYLSRVYKAETGENLSEYTHKLRMDKSSHMLKATDLKIFEVGEILGYMNTPYFIRVFKKHYGCTPQEYREAWRQ